MRAARVTLTTPAGVRPATVTTGLAARGVVQGVVGRGFSFAFAYLATIVLARWLGPAEYGVYGVIVSVLIVIQQTGRFTIPPAAAKLISEDEIRSTAIQQTALFLGTLLFLCLFVLLWITAGPLAVLFGLSNDGASLFRIAALELPLFGVYAIYRGVLQGRHDFLALSVADALYAGAKLAAVVLLLGFWLSVSSALVANVLASLGALLFVISRISIKIRWPSPGAVTPLVHLALPLGLYMLALQTISYLDLWSLKVLAPGEQAATIGLYVAARNVAIVPGVVLMVVSDVLLPSLSRALANGDTGLSRAYIQGAVRFLGILIAPLVLVLMLGADDIMSFLYSGEFRTGGAYVKVLVLYAVALPFIDLFASALSARGEPYRGGATVLLVIPLMTVLNVTLIGWWGPIGAAYSSALAGLSGAVILGVLVFRRFGPLVTRRTLLNIAVATTALVLVARLFPMRDSLPLVAYIACLGTYSLTLVLLREVRRNDLEPLALWKWGFR
jgi:O-antigen/teichoic acid export membrane protein